MTIMDQDPKPIVRMPLPLAKPAGPGLSRSLRRPVSLLGMATGLYLYINSFALLWTNLPMLFIPLILVFLTILPTVTMVFSVLFARELRSKELMLFFATMFFPVARLAALFGYRTLLEGCLIAMGDVEQGLDQPGVAAACYGAGIRQFKPFWRDSSTQREYAVALAYAGKLAEALAYSEQLVVWTRQAVDCLKNEETMVRLVYNTHTSAMVLELAGDNDRACRLKFEVYEAVADMPMDSEARIVGLLCAGEAYVQEGKYARAVPLLQEFVTFAKTSFLITCSSTYMGSGYRNLAIALAHTGQKESAKTAAKEAHKRVSKDMAPSSWLSDAIVDAELAACDGRPADALAKLYEAEKKAGGAARETVLRMLKAKRKELSLPGLPDEQSTDRISTRPVSSISVSNKVETNAADTTDDSSKTNLIHKGHPENYFADDNRVRLYRISAEKTDAIMKANKRRLVRAIVKGNALELSETNGSKIGRFYINSIVTKQLILLTKNEEFKTVAYAENNGALAVIEIFGYPCDLCKSG